MKVRNNLRLGYSVQQVENATGIAIRMMMEDTHRLADPITPYKENGLRSSVSKQMVGPMKGTIKWNVPYAQYQERGMRADGTRAVKNYTTPGTHAHFVEESVNQVVNRIPRYLAMGGLV